MIAAIDRELLTDKSAKEISVKLAVESGWSKREVYRLINRED
jgi:hypothetical protein